MAYSLNSNDDDDDNYNVDSIDIDRRHHLQMMWIEAKSFQKELLLTICDHYRDLNVSLMVI